MTHTAGLTYGRFEPGPVGEAYRQIDVNFGNAGATLADMARKAASVPLCFQPGSKWTYPVATDVLGRVVEVVAGKPLDRVFTERIPGPPGMVDTAFGVPTDTAARTCSCHAKTPPARWRRVDAPAPSRYSLQAAPPVGEGGD